MKHKEETSNPFCLNERHVAQIVRRNMLSKRKESAKIYSRGISKRELRNTEI